MQFLEGGGHLPQMPHPGSAIGQDDARADIHARGFWGRNKVPFLT